MLIIRKWALKPVSGCPTAYGWDWKPLLLSIFCSWEPFSMATNNPPKDTGTQVAFARASSLASNTEQWVLALQVGTFLTRLAAARVLFSQVPCSGTWGTKPCPSPFWLRSSRTLDTRGTHPAARSSVVTLCRHWRCGQTIQQESRCTRLQEGFSTVNA